MAVAHIASLREGPRLAGVPREVFVSRYLLVEDELRVVCLTGQDETIEGVDITCLNLV